MKECSQKGPRRRRGLDEARLKGERSLTRQTSFAECSLERVASPKGWPRRSSPEGRAKSGLRSASAASRLRRDRLRLRNARLKEWPARRAGLDEARAQRERSLA